MFVPTSFRSRALAFVFLSAAAARAAAPDPADSLITRVHRMDSVMTVLRAEEKKLVYQAGSIDIGDGLAAAKLDSGYRFLGAQQSQTVLTRMWGNPPDNDVLGMIFPPSVTPLTHNAWAVIISYSEDGYVKDGDADKIDYDDLMKDIRKSEAEANKERAKEGYESIHMLGWAEKPYYDKAAHKLHWAKALRFGDSPDTTLNYNIRILGRKGVLVLNAVSGIEQLAQVKEGVKPILRAVEFNEGKRYADFKPDIDKVATYGIAGLVAGTLLAKVGFFKLLIVGLLAAKKFIVIGVLAVVAFVRRMFGGKQAPEQKTIEDVTRPLPEEKESQK